MGALAAMIRAHVGEIVELWYDEARRARVARGLTREELTRALPEHLTAVAARIEGQPTATAGELVDEQVNDRLRQGYELADVIREYALLERCIYQTWTRMQRGGDWPPEEEISAVHAALGEVVRVAVGAFAEHFVEEEQLEKRHLRMLQRLACEGGALSERLHAMLEELRLALSARAVVMFLYDPHAGTLALEGCVGVRPDGELVTALGRSPLLEAVAAAPRILRLERVGIASLDADLLRPAVREGLGALLGARLRHASRDLGALVVGVEAPPEPRRVRRLQALAERLALLVENARLYEQAQRDLEHLREERGLRDCFVSTLAHDLRGPLSAAQVNAEVLARRSSSPEVRTAAARVVRSLHTAEELIRDLLDVHRVRAGLKLPLHVTACDLAEVARDVIEELQAIYGDGRLEVEIAATVPGLWCAHELRRALWNLASNALKYGDASRPVRVRVERVADGVRVTVHNHGPPIPTEDHPHIFEPFQRAGLQRRRGAGWGLGLALVKACAEAHGGHVEMRSTGESGTTFTMWVPHRAQEAASLRI